MRQFTTDWFAGRRPYFEEALDQFKTRDELRFLEIGAWEGQCTCWLADEFPQAIIEVIDTFKGNPEHIEKDLYDLPTLRDRFLENTRAHKDRIVINEGTSKRILPALWTRSYDFIYVDGSHDASDVFFDLALSWELLVPGGVMAMDDYTWRQDLEPHLRPKPAIDAFLTCYADELKVLHKKASVIVQKS